MASYIINDGITTIPSDADAMQRMLLGMTLVKHPLAKKIKLRPQSNCTFIGMKHGWKLTFPQSSERILSWSAEEVAGVILHEIAHIERHDIRVPYDEVWNIAADIEINSRLRSEGVILPGDVVYLEHYGFSVEEYYELLKGDQ